VTQPGALHFMGFPEMLTKHTLDPTCLTCYTGIVAELFPI
jgi:hypothetical protein